jgi:hypothetical protein
MEFWRPPSPPVFFCKDVILKRLLVRTAQGFDSKEFADARSVQGTPVV